jgi:hypothetical protein
MLISWYFNVLVVSPQKSKVRFYLGQSLSPHKCYAPPIPNHTAALPPPDKVKTTLGQKVACSPPSPNSTTALPSPHLCLPPCRNRGVGKSETYQRSKCALCQNMTITIDVRTIRVNLNRPSILHQKQNKNVT